MEHLFHRHDLDFDADIAQVLPAVIEGPAPTAFACQNFPSDDINTGKF